MLTGTSAQALSHGSRVQVTKLHYLLARPRLAPGCGWSLCSLAMQETVTSGSLPLPAAWPVLSLVTWSAEGLWPQL